MTYRLQREIVAQTTMETAWDFIRRPANLNRITPDDLAFEIVTDVPEEMYEGMRIEYRVKIPLLGKRTWISELKNIVPGHSFVDVQLKGPYRWWYHYHAIEETDEGVRVIDRVEYEVPFGILGRFVHAFFIRRELNRIFDYREIKLKDLLNAGAEKKAAAM